MVGVLHGLALSLARGGKHAMAEDKLLEAIRQLRELDGVDPDAEDCAHKVKKTLVGWLVGLVSYDEFGVRYTILRYRVPVLFRQRGLFSLGRPWCAKFRLVCIVGAVLLSIL